MVDGKWLQLKIFVVEWLGISKELKLDYNFYEWGRP